MWATDMLRSLIWGILGNPPGLTDDEKRRVRELVDEAVNAAIPDADDARSDYVPSGGTHFEADNPPEGSVLPKEDMTTFPIVSCKSCYAPYRLEQWLLLELVDKDGPLERRKCCQCDRVLSTDVSAVEHFDYRISRRVYNQMYGKPH